MGQRVPERAHLQPAGHVIGVEWCLVARGEGDVVVVVGQEEEGVVGEVTRKAQRLEQHEQRRGVGRQHHLRERGTHTETGQR